MSAVKATNSHVVRWARRRPCGLSATTVMLSLGIPPATAIASVHAAEVFTTGISVAGAAFGPAATRKEVVR